MGVGVGVGRGAGEPQAVTSRDATTTMRLMKVTRSVRIALQAPVEGGQGHYGWILASQLADTLNRLLPTMPPQARVEAVIREMMGTYLAFVWEEELPADSSGA